MKLTETHLRNWFNEFNDRVFYGELAMPKFKFDNTYHRLGQFSPRGGVITIKISLYYDRNEEQYRNCLLHEMCHYWCYYKGYRREGHGSNWKAVANRAYRITGLKIQRTENISGWKVASENAEKEAKRVAKKTAPIIIVDLAYPTYHFVIKTTKNGIRESMNIIANTLNTNASSYRIMLCDGGSFQRWQTSRSIHRGYKYVNSAYNNIKPLIDKGIEVTDIRKLLRGHYDYLGIR